MSQCNVERVIGRLVTDEGFRRRFAESPAATLRSLTDQGVELNAFELRALAAIDPGQVGRFARTLQPWIQKVELEGDHS
ncbi:MAG TPA: Os1348 family NHLP clan protein [Thermoanaerobaculales bacterium]|nr:Os1348 family NHLP clan protein [Thermoanaerobaculales bacterium]HPA79493.1 Os1348 family NHLP clan protein [Thermoanaerobaculales bacterium]HQL29694.1 Os1348 family NHLP clan protein [Thermoanaerobaculales bacterium]HQN95428.1 Os1348 family NHLP clan protein [Thermoanaerobaculales bacterium]HQP44126.1 Os1348 family NHLP clan protein [Thermoanaerobaculales bacterium]